MQHGARWEYRKRWAGRRRGTSSPPHITPHFPSLYHAICCMMTTADKSVLEWLNLFNKFPGHITLGFTTNHPLLLQNHLLITIQNNEATAVWDKSQTVRLSSDTELVMSRTYSNTFEFTKRSVSEPVKNS